MCSTRSHFSIKETLLLIDSSTFLFVLGPCVKGYWQCHDTGVPWGGLVRYGSPQVLYIWILGTIPSGLFGVVFYYLIAMILNGLAFVGAGYNMNAGPSEPRNGMGSLLHSKSGFSLRCKVSMPNNWVGSGLLEFQLNCGVHLSLSG